MVKFNTPRHPVIPCEDRCLNPQTSPEVRLLRVPKTHSPGMTGGWLGCLGYSVFFDTFSQVGISHFF